MKYADDLFSVISGHGNAGKSFGFDRFHDLRAVRIDGDRNNILARGHNVLRAETVELEHVLYVFYIVLLQGAFVGACVKHEHYILLGDGLILRVGIDPDQTEHSVCRYGQKPYHRLQRDRKPRDHAAHELRKLFLVAHRNTLRNELAEHKREE